MASTDRRAKTLQWSVAGALAFCLLASTIARSDDSAHQPAATADSQTSTVLLGHGTERLPSESANDWVRSAEYIVEVRVAAERARPPAAIEIERGEGIILRDLDLEVTSVVWSAAGTGVAPRTLEWRAFGWHWKGNPAQRQELGVHGAPRMEVGHTYLLALDLPLPQCGDASTAVRASQTQWLGLGGSSVIPFDDGIVGKGEFEGQVDGLIGRIGPADSVLARTRGAGLSDVRELLRESARTTPPGPSARTCA